MTAFENATSFFIACEAPAGWAVTALLQLYPP